MATDTLLAPALATDLPGPRGWMLLDSLREIRRDRISFVERAAAQFGDFVAFRMGPKRLFLLRDPDLFRHVLVSIRTGMQRGRGWTRLGRFSGRAC